MESDRKAGPSRIIIEALLVFGPKNNSAPIFIKVPQKLWPIA